MDTKWLQRHRPAMLAIAVGLPLVWCAIAAQFRDSVTAATAALLLVLLVVAAAAIGDRFAGVAAALSGGLWFDYFLTAPFGRFTIEDANDVEVTVLLVLVGLAVTELALWGRRQQAQSSSRAGYLDGIMATSQIVAGQFSAATLADQVADHIADLLEVDSCRFVASSTPPPHHAALDPDGEVRVMGSLVNVDRDGLPTLDETVLLAEHHGVTYGQFSITAATAIMRPSLEQRRVAVLLANQVGAAYASESLGPHLQ